MAQKIFRMALSAAMMTVMFTCSCFVISYINRYLFGKIVYGVFSGNDLCMLSTSFTDSALCEYAYAVGAVGLLLGLIVLCRMCCAEGIVIDVALGALLTVWWIVAASIFTSFGTDANDAGLPLTKERNIVIGMSWAAAASSLIFTVLLLSFFRKWHKTTPEQVAAEDAKHRADEANIHGAGYEITKSDAANYNRQADQAPALTLSKSKKYNDTA